MARKEKERRGRSEDERSEVEEERKNKPSLGGEERHDSRKVNFETSKNHKSAISCFGESLLAF